MLARAETRRSWGRLSICVLAVALGVFALTLVRSLSKSVDESVSGQARETMGSDLVVSAREPLEQTNAEEFTRALEARGARSADLTSFMSMLTRTGAEKGSQLVRVRAFEDGYPFYGRIETSPPGLFANLSETPRVIVDRQVAGRLSLEPGDEVRLGELTLTVAGEFIPRPGSPAAGFSIAPSIYVHARYLPETALLARGSRVRYERHFSLPPSLDATTWKQAQKVQREGPGRASITTADENSTNVERFLDRLGGFLTIVAVMTLLLGAVGIGSSMSAFMRQKLDHAAIFRCIGVTPRGIFVVYGLMSLWIASVGCALGAGLGVSAPLLLERAVSSLGAGLLPEGVTLGFHPEAAVFGVLAGLVATVSFTIIPVLRTALVSPLRILRRNVETADAKTILRRAVAAVISLALVCAGLVATLTDGREGRVGLAFSLAVILAGGALWVLAALLVRLARFVAARLGSYAIRQGVANLHRPGNQTTSVVVSIGLGVLLVTSMLILQRSLEDAIAVDESRELPNLFVIDIQTDQVREVMAEIRARGAREITQVPMVAARISAINDRPVVDSDPMKGESEDEERGNRSWSSRIRTREYFISYRPALIESETVTEGHFWSGTPERQEASIDVELAANLGITLGDVITLNIQGLPLDAVVTSFRQIHWQAIRPNSLILLSPGEIEDAPQQHVASFRVPDEQRYELQTNLVEKYPNLTVIDVTEASKTILLIIHRISVVFRGLGSLAIIAGILVLIGAVASGRYARQRESMLLKVVGAKRATLTRILVTEQITLATLGALCGWLLAEILSRGLWPLFFDVPVRVPYELLAPLLISVVAASAALGALVSHRVSRRPALEILREE